MSINNYLRNESAQFLPNLKDGASLGNKVIGQDSSYSLLACLTPQRKGVGPDVPPKFLEPTPLK